MLISCHACHPSLSNDNLSGMALAMTLARRLRERSLRYSYRFLFIPGTIGSITWLARNEGRVDRIEARAGAGVRRRPGLVHLQEEPARRPRRSTARSRTSSVSAATSHRIEDFSPYGYDERQYCSPGFNLPVGCFMRTPHGQYPEYHTSADNLDFVSPEPLAGSLETCLGVLEVLEGNARYLSQNPKGEPQLGRRGLYRSMGG